MIRFSLKINKLKHISEEHSELIKLKEEWLEIEEKLQNDNLQSEESISNKIKTISDFFYEKVLSNNELKSNEWWKKHVKTTIVKPLKYFKHSGLGGIGITVGIERDYHSFLNPNPDFLIPRPKDKSRSWFRPIPIPSQDRDHYSKIPIPI